MEQLIGRLLRQNLVIGILLGVVVMPSSGQGQEDPKPDAILARFEQMVRFNLDNDHVLPSSTIDSVMQELEGKPVGERIAHWAEHFHRDGRARYLFGLDEGGYVKEGRLCDDFQTDCVLFLYRTTELGRSSSAQEAAQFAFGTRFYGASVEEAILPDGHVKYQHAAHLDYSEDILRTGIWGKDVTESIGPTQPDPGNDRFEAGTLSFVPSDKIDESALRSGDLVYFILDENDPKGAEARAQGILIHHLGVLVCSEKRCDLIHAAKAPLPNHYEGGKIERIALKTYLGLVERFKGIVVTRIEEF
jgi:hypothetical protein